MDAVVVVCYVVFRDSIIGGSVEVDAVVVSVMVFSEMVLLEVP